MTPLKLSVVLCSYNGAAYLPSQLDSLLAQTRLPDELVLRDDASSDRTLDILQAFADTARARGIAVTLLRNERNVGYVENFSAALRQASGDVLFLCDQDDVWRADKLSLMAARFAADPTLLLLHSDARLVDADGAPTGCGLFESLQLRAAERAAIHAGHAFEVVLRRSFVTGATAALRRALLAQALPVAAGWVHDEWLAAVAAAAGRVDCIDAPLIDYRQHGGNQIGARRRTLAMQWQDLIRPRGSLLAAEASRLQSLETFLAASGLPFGIEYAFQVGRKRVHFEHRIAIGRLPAWRRLRPILHEARSGDYRRFGTGIRSMVRDLLRHD